jgi:hypothetical protein
MTIISIFLCVPIWYKNTKNILVVSQNINEIKKAAKPAKEKTEEAPDPMEEILKLSKTFSKEK